MSKDGHALGSLSPCLLNTKLESSHAASRRIFGYTGLVFRWPWATVVFDLVLCVNATFLKRYFFTNRTLSDRWARMVRNLVSGHRSEVHLFALGAGLYFLLRFRYRQPVLKPLGWVVPQMAHIVTALILGPLFAAGIALYLRLRNQITPSIPIGELLVLGLVLGPLLEESLFRGCLLPVLAKTTGTIPAVIINAVLFALFHGPTNLVHWVSFAATGIAYGWMRVVSRSTTAPALMHAAYNLSLYLVCAS